MTPSKRTNRITKKAVRKRQTRVVKKIDASDDISRVKTDSDEVCFEELDQEASTSVSSVSSDLPPPAKRRKIASVERKAMPQASETTSTEETTKRKTPGKKSPPSKRTVGSRRTKKKAIPLQSEPTTEPSHPPANPPSEPCQPEENQPIAKTTTAPPNVAIITEPPTDQTHQPQKDAKTATVRKSSFWFWPWSSASKNDSTLSDEPVPTVLMDAAHLSVETPKPEDDPLELTDEEIPKKPEVSNPEHDEQTK